jgi:predicted dehydrogenase
MKGDNMLRAAIVGLGSWGQVLVTSVQGKSDTLRFVAGHTRTPGKVEAFCRAKGLRLAGSFDEILGDPTVDVVVPATPNSQHAKQVMQAARAGKHVFVEKPFTLESRSARDGRRQPIPLDEILHGVCVFEAAVESARSGQSVLVKF